MTRPTLILILRSTDTPSEGSIIEGKYIPSSAKWVRDQVELYEGSNGAEGYTIGEPNWRVVIVTHHGQKTGGIRKAPVMRVTDGDNYIIVASLGGGPKHPSWYFNLKANPNIELRDKADVFTMRVREVEESPEKQRLWDLAVEAYPPYKDYQEKTTRVIPVFVAERTD